jgi:hypothetical protein
MQLPAASFLGYGVYAAAQLNKPQQQLRSVTKISVNANFNIADAM